MRPAHIISLGKWRYPAWCFCAFITLLTLGIPLGVILFWLVRDYTGWSAWATTLPLMWNSLTVAGLAAVACVFAAMPIVLYATRYPSRSSRWTERCAYIGYALPGIVVALSLVFFSARYLPTIYQTLGLLVAAYVILFLPLAIGSLRASILHISPCIEEAARALGLSSAQTFRRVTLPLLRPGCVAGMALVFLTSMKELPATLILGPIGFRTLATHIWGATEEALFGRAALPALILLFVSACSLWFILAQEDRVVTPPISSRLEGRNT